MEYLGGCGRMASQRNEEGAGSQRRSGYGGLQRRAVREGLKLHGSLCPFKLLGHRDMLKEKLDGLGCTFTNKLLTGWTK